MSSRPGSRLNLLILYGFVAAGIIQFIFALALVEGKIGLLVLGAPMLYIDIFFYHMPLILTWAIASHTLFFYYPRRADDEYQTFLSERYPWQRILLVVSLWAVALVLLREVVVPLAELMGQALNTERGDMSLVATMRAIADSVPSTELDAVSARLRYLLLAAIPLLTIFLAAAWRPRRPVVPPGLLSWAGAILLLVVLMIGYEALIQGISPFFLTIHPILP